MITYIFSAMPILLHHGLNSEKYPADALVSTSYFHPPLMGEDEGDRWRGRSWATGLLERRLCERSEAISFLTLVRHTSNQNEVDLEYAQ